MDGTAVRYVFRLPDGTERSFETEARPGGSEPPRPQASLPDWVALDHCRCPHCPLPSHGRRWCPAAASIAEFVEAFDAVFSYETVALSVVTDQRTTLYDSVPIQRALGSLMGLVLPMSGCPHTAFLRPMALFHLPLASVEETVFRAASTFLLAQWFLRQDGGDTDFRFEDLDRRYRRLQAVNRSLHARLEGSTVTDSSLNAVVVLDVLAQFMPMAMDESLADLRPAYQAFLDELER